MSIKRKLKLINILNEDVDADDEDDDEDPELKMQNIAKDVTKQQSSKPPEASSDEPYEVPDEPYVEPKKKEKLAPYDKDHLDKLKKSDFGLGVFTPIQDKKKDVNVSVEVIKSKNQQWTTEIMIEFDIKATHEFKSKFTTVHDNGEFGRFYFNQALADLDKRFGKNAVYHTIDKLKKELDQKYYASQYVLEWDDPAVAYENNDSYRQKLQSQGQQGLTVPSQLTRNHAVGYYIRFKLPKQINSEKIFYAKVAKKIIELMEEITKLPTFSSDKFFILEPHKSN